MDLCLRRSRRPFDLEELQVNVFEGLHDILDDLLDELRHRRCTPRDTAAALALLHELVVNLEEWNGPGSEPPPAADFCGPCTAETHLGEEPGGAGLPGGSSVQSPGGIPSGSELGSTRRVDDREDPGDRPSGLRGYHGGVGHHWGDWGDHH